ncbi:DUF2007 domain-containing protein [Mangrovibacterium marinum]|uniref:Putative signal transducing protein n=1 Tax=Mangrovibacterium marinum TaxID=1639118 RepID=A0A2T5C5W9_9BACT|nr:DUF2007 domain-containing protein [Mangrovibacterium marinum]PTN10307.1 putative signal transducing protein [Mangrovibacterium marinum]
MEKDFVLIYRTTVPFQAEIARDLLTDNGVNCVVLNQQDSAIPSFGEMKVYVHQNDREQALNLLKNLIN